MKSLTAMGKEKHERKKTRVPMKQLFSNLKNPNLEGTNKQKNKITYFST